MKVRSYVLLLMLMISGYGINAQQNRARDYNIEFGVLPTGHTNSILDVKGVSVGHVTKIEGDNIRTGVTAILPHDSNIFQQKIPAAIYLGNGFGKLAGYSQVEELGLIETPIILTNTLSVADAMKAVIKYTLDQPGNENVRSVNAVVGETNDGYLNDIRGMHITEEDVLKAIKGANNEKVEEGNIGAGTGTRCFGFKGGIGTSSRVLPQELGGYTVGVIVQTNFGGTLRIGSQPVGKMLGKYPYKDAIESADGSCMIVIATDAPADAHNLKRIAKRAMLGLARTGGIASNGSGDYAIAFSTAEENRIPYESKRTQDLTFINNDYLSPIFLATIEATEEAIINSLFAAETMIGQDGHLVEALPIEEVLELIRTNK